MSSGIIHSIKKKSKTQVTGEPEVDAWTRELWEAEAQFTAMVGSRLKMMWASDVPRACQPRAENEFDLKPSRRRVAKNTKRRK